MTYQPNSLCSFQPSERFDFSVDLAFEANKIRSMPTKTTSFRVFPFLIIGLALILKFFLFFFTNTHAPASKIQLDSHLYLKAGKMIAQEGVFAVHELDGRLKPVTVRTPGYPLFIALFHHFLNIPLTGIILIQIGLTLFSAWITYKTAVLINPRYGFLSAVIVLYDLPTTVSSLMILTESVFLVFITLFMLNMVLYLKEKKLKHLAMSALLIVCAAYVRPLVFFLPVVTALFIWVSLADAPIKKKITHVLFFLFLSYAAFLPWQVRNYRHTGQFNFSTIRTITMDMEGVNRPSQSSTGSGTTRVLYYGREMVGGLMDLMTYPGTLKYFGSKPLKFWGKVFAYPWMIFWLTGFIVGAFRSRQNPYLMFFLVVLMYFVAVTIGSTLSSALGRFRVPMMPFLAIISAHGWFLIMSYLRQRNK